MVRHQTAIRILSIGLALTGSKLVPANLTTDHINEHSDIPFSFCLFRHTFGCLHGNEMSWSSNMGSCP